MTPRLVSTLELERDKLLSNFAFNSNLRHYTKADYEADYGVVQEMYDMLTTYEMKVPAGDQIKLDDLNESVTALSDSMARAEDYIDSRKAEMMSSMKKVGTDEYPSATS